VGEQDDSIRMLDGRVARRLAPKRRRSWAALRPAGAAAALVAVVVLGFVFLMAPDEEEDAAPGEPGAPVPTAVAAAPERDGVLDVVVTSWGAASGEARVELVSEDVALPLARLTVAIGAPPQDIQLRYAAEAVQGRLRLEIDELSEGVVVELAVVDLGEEVPAQIEVAVP
jgi:hypothetical protein